MACIGLVQEPKMVNDRDGAARASAPRSSGSRVANCRSRIPASPHLASDHKKQPALGAFTLCVVPELKQHDNVA